MKTSKCEKNPQGIGQAISRRGEILEDFDGKNKVSICDISCKVGSSISFSVIFACTSG
jgi:hypothetical protein